MLYFSCYICKKLRLKQLEDDEATCLGHFRTQGIEMARLKLQFKREVQKNASSDNENTLNVSHL